MRGEREGQIPVVLLACAMACGGATAPTDDGGTDAATDAHQEAATADAAADVDLADASLDGGVSCSPDLPSGYTSTWIPPLSPSTVCTAGQIQSLYDACHGPNQSGSACNSFTSSNQACVACMQTPIQASAYGATIAWHSGDALEANVGGCMALVDGDLSANGCGAKYEAWDSCVIAACSYCQLGTFESCAAPARAGECGAYESAAEQCLKDPKYAECTSAPTFEAYFVTFGAMFCSAGPPDASAD